jgi:DNA polymerase III subunit epsilon
MAVFLDTETTCLSPTRGDAIVELAIVDAAGRVLIDTLVDPERPVPWQAAQVHGITDDMVRGQPTLAQLMPRVLEVIAGEWVVIYNAGFDVPFFPGRLAQSAGVRCAMTRFADTLGGPWRNLDVAARHVGHRWTGTKYRALADALACRSVWDWLEAREG